MKTPRIGVLCAANLWHVDDLRRAAKLRGLDLELADPENLRAECPAGQDASRSVRCGTLELSELDALLIRSVPGGSLEQVVYRMDALQALQSAGVTIINPPRAIEVAVDKYLCLCRLQDAGLAVPRTLVCEDPDEAMDAFLALDEKVLVKPLFGSEGRGILRPCNREDARNTFSEIASAGGVFYLQEFIDHGGSDLRLLVIDGKVTASMRRTAPPGEWLTNIARGGAAELVEAGDRNEEFATRAAEAVGAGIAGVDIIEGPDGSPRILEVNAIPGWRALGEVSGKDISLKVIDYALEKIARRESEPAGALQP